MPEVAILLFESGESTEIPSTIDSLATVLRTHGASLGDVRRVSVRHPALVDETILGGLPVLVRAEGSTARAAVRAATEALCDPDPDASGDDCTGWFLVVASKDSEPDDALVTDLRRTFDARVVTPAFASLPARIVSELDHRGLVLSAAESCTGGMLGEQITSFPGSSTVFWGSLVTYSYEAKSAVLGVERGTLEEYGAVSEEVVCEMAAGVRRISGSDISVAISGIAGPGGGTEGKPVGTVWIACETSWSGVTARLLRLEGGRDCVRRGAVWECLRLVASLWNRGG